MSDRDPPVIDLAERRRAARRAAEAAARPAPPPRPPAAMRLGRRLGQGLAAVFWLTLAAGVAAAAWRLVGG